MDIPSAFIPATISHAYYQAPDMSPMLMHAIDNFNKQHEVNEQSLDNFNKFVKSQRTFDDPRIQEAFNQAMKPYSDAITSTTKALESDPMAFMSKSRELRSLGRKLTDDMLTGQLGNMTESYTNFTKDYAEKLKDKNYNEEDVRLLGGLKKETIINDLLAGKKYTSGGFEVPRFINVAEKASAFAKEYDESVLENSDGSSFKGVNPEVKQRYITEKLRNDPEIRAYLDGMASGGVKDYSSQIEAGVDPLTKKPLYYGMTVDKKGNPVYGTTSKKEDAISPRELYFRSLVSTEMLNTPSSVEQPESKPDDTGLAIVSGTPEGVGNNGTTKAPAYWSPNLMNDKTSEFYVIDHPIDDGKGGTIRSLNDRIRNGAPDEREAAKAEKQRLEDKYKELSNKHDYVRNVVRQKLIDSGVDPKVLALIGEDKKIERRLNEIQGFNPFSSPRPNLFFNVFFNSRQPSAEAAKLAEQLSLARSITEKYNKIYFATWNSLHENQANTRDALGLANSPKTQQAVAAGITNDSASVSVNGVTNPTDTKKILDDIINNDYTSKSSRFSFVKLIPTVNNRGNVQVIDRGADGKGNKIISLNVSSDVLATIQKHIGESNASQDIKSFASTWTDNDRQKLFKEISTAALPVSSTNYGPIKEISINADDGKGNQTSKGKLTAYIRRTSQGGILMSVRDSRTGNYHVFPLLYGSNKAIGSAVELLKTLSNTPANQITNDNKTGIDPLNMDIFAADHIITNKSEVKKRDQEENDYDPFKYGSTTSFWY